MEVVTKMSSTEMKNNRMTLERFFDQQAEETITKEEKERILAPTLTAIASGQPLRSRHRLESRKKQMLALAYAILAARTKSGKVAINFVVIEN